MLPWKLMVLFAHWGYGTFSFVFAREKFGHHVKARINCEWLIRGSEIWFKSTQTIRAGEELFTRYTHDNFYWTAEFTSEQLGFIRTALISASENTLKDAESIIRNIHL